MKFLTAMVATGLLIAGTSSVWAGETESGQKEGESIGAFYVTKLAGAEDDGVEAGKNLCYRCKNGSRPQVMVFTRSCDEKVVKLIQELDKKLSENSDKELRAFVSVLAEEKSDATAAGKALTEQTKAKHVPFVVPNECENGPENYGLNAKAAVTIIMAEGGKVKANHAFADANDVAVDSVVKDLSKILN